MNHIDIITCQPKLLDGPLNNSIIQKAKEKKLINIEIHNLRDHTNNKHKKVDDYAYGGGGGMVLGIEPIYNCINYIKGKKKIDEVIYMSPDGNKLEQKLSNKLSLKKNIIILCGHYKGIDERVREHIITMEISIGDYVLTGGELPAAILVDSIVRLLQEQYQMSPLRYLIHFKMDFLVIQIIQDQKNLIIGKFQNTFYQ